MHAAYKLDCDTHEEDARVYADVPDQLIATAPAVGKLSPRSSFASQRGPNWLACGLIAGLHVVVLGLLLKYDVIHIVRPKAEILTVNLITVPPTPPPAEEVKVVKQKPVDTPIVTPPPIVSVPIVQAPLLTVTPDPTPRPVVDTPVAPPVPSGPVVVKDLSSTMIYSPNPKIPLESRKKREGGTIHIAVTLGVDGHVQEASLSRGCGFPRLDAAVLDAVRRWRWSPTVRDGQPVMVRGVVDITINPPSA